MIPDWWEIKPVWDRQEETWVHFLLRKDLWKERLPKNFISWGFISAFSHFPAILDQLIVNSQRMFTSYKYYFFLTVIAQLWMDHRYDVFFRKLVVYHFSMLLCQNMWLLIKQYASYFSYITCFISYCSKGLTKVLEYLYLVNEHKLSIKIPLVENFTF